MPSHTRRRSRPTCRRRRRRRPPAGRRRARSRCRGRSGGARRATARAAAESARARRGRRATGTPHVEPSSVRERTRRDVASLPGALRIARHGYERVDGGRRHDLGEDRGGLAGEPPPSTLLPRPNERACLGVVDDRRARAREREPPPRALGAAPHRPRPRRPAAVADAAARAASNVVAQRSHSARPGVSQIAHRSGSTRSSTRTRSTVRATGVTTPQRSRADSSPDQIGDAETSSRRSSCARSRSAGVLIGEKRPRGPRRGHLEVLRGNERGDLVVQPFELHRDAPVDVLLHVEPAQVVVASSASMSKSAVFVLKTGSELLVERLREARALDELQPSVRRATGAPPMSPSLRATSHVSALPAERGARPRRRVDARPEVVDVRDRDDADAAAAELVERSASARTALNRSPWPGAYSDGRSDPSTEELAGRTRAAARRTGGRRAGRRARARRRARGPRRRSAKLVISATGTVQSSARSSAAVWTSFASRKLMPSTAVSTALTTPPNRVAMPPARTTCATSPRDRAVDACLRAPRRTPPRPAPGAV